MRTTNRIALQHSGGIKYRRRPALDVCAVSSQMHTDSRTQRRRLILLRGRHSRRSRSALRDAMNRTSPDAWTCLVECLHDDTHPNSARTHTLLTTRYYAVACAACGIGDTHIYTHTRDNINEILVGVRAKFERPSSAHTQTLAFMRITNSVARRASRTPVSVSFVAGVRAG